MIIAKASDLILMDKAWVDAPGRTFVALEVEGRESSETTGYFKTAAGYHFGFLKADGTAKINSVFHSDD